MMSQKTEDRGQKTEAPRQPGEPSTNKPAPVPVSPAKPVKE